MGWWGRGEDRRPELGDVLRPAPTSYPELIRGAGAAITTLHVLEGQGRVRWMTRDQPLEGVPDNGWRIFGELDAADYLDDPSNSTVVDYNRLCALEPVLISIWDLPVGSELELVRGRRSITIIDSSTGLELPEGRHFVPEQFRS